MTKTNRIDLLANAYKRNACVINVLKNKCICLNAQIDFVHLIYVIYSQMHLIYKTQFCLSMSLSVLTPLKLLVV